MQFYEFSKRKIYCHFGLAGYLPGFAKKTFTLIKVLLRLFSPVVFANLILFFQDIQH